MTTTRPEQPAPDYVPGHDLLAGKVVAVTAGAGVWVVCAVIVGSLLPPASHHRLREAPQH